MIIIINIEYLHAQQQHCLSGRVDYGFNDVFGIVMKVAYIIRSYFYKELVIHLLVILLNFIYILSIHRIVYTGFR